MTIYPDRVKRGDPGGRNGCGPEVLGPDFANLLNSITGFSDQCDNHDLCYSNCEETKISCDNEFHDILLSQCNYWHDTLVKGVACKKVADILYNAVRQYGASAFDAAQSGCRLKK